MDNTITTTAGLPYLMSPFLQYYCMKPILYLRLYRLFSRGTAD